MFLWFAAVLCIIIGGHIDIGMALGILLYLTLPVHLLRGHEEPYHRGCTQYKYVQWALILEDGGATMFEMCRIKQWCVEKFFQILHIICLINSKGVFANLATFPKNLDNVINNEL